MSFSGIEFLDTYEAVINFNTVLRNNITESSTEIPVVSVDNLPQSGWVTLAGQEIIFYNSLITGAYPALSGCERPTNSKNWTANTLVEQRYNAEVIEELIKVLR